MSYFVPIILGTAREGRESEKVARYVESQLKKHTEFETQIVDPKVYITAATVPSWVLDEKMQGWRDVAGRADGFIIVTPEYNHGYPGELKLLLDGALKEYEKKPVLLAGVSSGPFGGTRVVENLKPILAYIKMIFVQPPLYFPNVGDLFDETGSIKDSAHDERVGKALQELLSYLELLRGKKS